MYSTCSVVYPTYARIYFHHDCKRIVPHHAMPGSAVWDYEADDVWKRRKTRV